MHGKKQVYPKTKTADIPEVKLFDSVRNAKIELTFS